MSEDLIRRSDAIKALDANFTIKGKENMQTVLNYLELVRTRIEGAPTIEPKYGEWIFKPLFPNDESEFPMGHLECSVCGSHHSNSMPCNYCDNCGARMKGADDELVQRQGKFQRIRRSVLCMEVDR